MHRATSVNEAHQTVVMLRRECQREGNQAGWHLLYRVATRLEEQAKAAIGEMMAE
jgi:hypothetical protein